MKAVDTNVLVRFFVQDDRQQCERARERIAKSRGQPLYVSGLVVAELVWVLRSRHRRPVQEIQAVVSALLTSPAFLFRDRDLVARARQRWQVGRGDFADYLIQEHARSAGG